MTVGALLRVAAPDPDEAREWAEQELAHPRYAPPEVSFFDRIALWIAEALANLFNVQVSSQWGTVLTIALVVVLIAVAVAALLIWGRPRAARRLRRDGKAIFEDDDIRSARELRAEARKSATSGDFDTAVVLTFRALTRSLIERDVLIDRPGLTSGGMQRDASVAFPDHHDELVGAANTFDDVRYGQRRATENLYTRLVELDERLTRARPVLLEEDELSLLRTPLERSAGISRTRDSDRKAEAR